MECCIIDQYALVWLHGEPQNYARVRVQIVGHTYQVLACLAPKLRYPVLLG